MEFTSEKLHFQEISFGDAHSMYQLFADPRCIREYSRLEPITVEIEAGTKSMIGYSIANQQNTPRTYVILGVRRKSQTLFAGYVRAIMEPNIVEVYFDFFPTHYREALVKESLSSFLDRLPPVFAVSGP
jgi:hypothetical protein